MLEHEPAGGDRTGSTPADGTADGTTTPAAPVRRVRTTRRKAAADPPTSVAPNSATPEATSESSTDGGADPVAARIDAGGSR